MIGGLTLYTSCFAIGQFRRHLYLMFPFIKTETFELGICYNYCLMNQSFVVVSHSVVSVLQYILYSITYKLQTVSPNLTWNATWSTYKIIRANIFIQSSLQFIF